MLEHVEKRVPVHRIGRLTGEWRVATFVLELGGVLPLAVTGDVDNVIKLHGDGLLVDEVVGISADRRSGNVGQAVEYVDQFLGTG